MASTVTTLGPDPLLAGFLSYLATGAFTLLIMLNLWATGWFMMATEKEKIAGTHFTNIWQSWSGLMLFFSFIVHAMGFTEMIMWYGNLNTYGTQAKNDQIFGLMVIVLVVNLITFGWKWFCISYQFNSDSQVMLDTTGENSSFIVDVTNPFFRRFVKKQINCNVKAFRMAMFCIYYLAFIGFLLIPVVYMWTIDDAGCDSQARTYLTVGICAFIVGVIISEMNKYWGVRRAADFIYEKMVAGNRRRNSASTQGTDISGNMAISKRLGTVEIKPVREERTENLLALPGYALKSSHPLTPVLLTAESSIKDTERATELKGLTKRTMMLRQLGKDNNAIHVLPPSLAYKFDKAFKAGGIGLENAHIGFFAHPKATVSYDDGYDPKQPTKFNQAAIGLLTRPGTNPDSGAKVWMENNIWVDDDDYRRAKLPLIGRYTEDIIGWDIFNHKVGGFGVGYGIWFNLSSFVPAVFVGNYLAIYFFILHNGAAAFMAWVCTAVQALLLAFLGHEGQFIELFFTTFFIFWSIVIGGYWYLPADQRYIFSTAVWDNTAVWQENSTLTTFDQVPLVYSYTMFIMIVDLVLFCVVVFNWGCLACCGRKRINDSDARGAVDVDAKVRETASLKRRFETYKDADE